MVCRSHSPVSTEKLFELEPIRLTVFESVKFWLKSFTIGRLLVAIDAFDRIKAQHAGLTRATRLLLARRVYSAPSDCAPVVIGRLPVAVHRLIGRLFRASLASLLDGLLRSPLRSLLRSLFKRLKERDFWGDRPEETPSDWTTFLAGASLGVRSFVNAERVLLTR